jgi:hypothetical protein
MLAPLTWGGGVDVTSADGAARIGPYGLVANPGAARQLCSYYLE